MPEPQPYPETEGESASETPKPALETKRDEILAHDAAEVRVALDLFLVNPTWSGGDTVVTKYAVLWCDWNGSSLERDPDPAKRPNLVSTETETWVWRADHLGDRYCRVERTEFPELFELHARFSDPTHSELLSPRPLPEELRTRIVHRAREILALAEAR